MLIVLSPAKTLDFDSPVTFAKATNPGMLKQTTELVSILKTQSPKQLRQLMGISEKLAELNHGRYQDFEIPLPKKACKQAALAFQGDVYQGLLATEMTDKQLLYAQDHLRILSGLYGVLRPLDRILPYRLEMGTPLKNKVGKDLYAFWGDQITRAINQQIAATQSKCLLNLASGEYYRSVKAKDLSCAVVAPAFKEFKNGKYKIISFFAKKARGTMAAWVIRKQVKSTAKIAKFDDDGYRFDEQSSTEAAPVFLRG